MAEQERPPEKLSRTELIAALEQSRVELSDDLLDLRDSLSVTRKLENSYQNHIGKWLAGGALAGFFLARPLFRIGAGRGGKSKRARAGLEGATAFGGPIARLASFAGKNAGKLALPIIKVAVTSYVGKLIGALPDGEKTPVEADTLDG